MKRRAVLTGTGAISLLTVSGCLGDLGRGSTEISDVDFETGVDNDKAFNDDPTVSFEDEEIHVTGTYSTGSSCYNSHLPEPTYDAESDELRINLTRQHNGSDRCNDEDQRVSYRVVVRVEGALPNVVKVTEDVGGETSAESGFSPF